MIKEKQYFVEKLLNLRITINNKTESGKFAYLVKWENFDLDDAEYVDWKNIDTSLIDDFHKENPGIQYPTDKKMMYKNRKIHVYE